MNRRTFLSMLGGGVSAGITGCLSRNRDGTDGVVTCADESTHTPRDESELEAVDGTWPSVHFDARNTGHDPNGSGPEGCPTTQWTFTLEDRGDNSVRFSPVVVDGTVFTGRYAVFAVDARSGEREWESTGLGGFARGAVARGGTVYFAKESDVQSFDIETGTRTIVAQTDVDLQSPPTVVDDTMYVGLRDGSVLAVATTGGIRWRQALGGSTADEDDIAVHRTPAVGSGTVYAGTSAGTFHALDAATGEPRWTRSLDSSLWGAPVVGDGRVYVPEEYAVKAFGTDGGETEWTLFGGEDGYVVGSPALADGTLYVQVGPSLEEIQLLAVDASTGDRLWARSIPRPRASPVVVDGEVYLGAGGELGAFDAESGELRWSVQPDGIPPASAIRHAVAVVDGVVFVAASNEGLLAVA